MKLIVLYVCTVNASLRTKHPSTTSQPAPARPWKNRNWANEEEKKSIKSHFFATVFVVAHTHTHSRAQARQIIVNLTFLSQWKQKEIKIINLLIHF